MPLKSFFSFAGKSKLARSAALFTLWLVIMVLTVIPAVCALFLDELTLFNRVMMLVVSTTGGLFCWVILRTMHRRQHLLVAFEQATLRVQQGDFTQKVEIRSNGEFQRLGAAFNTMTAQLNVSFQTMTSLSELDRLILSGAAIKNVVKHVLASTYEIHGINSFVFLWKKTPLLGQLFFSDEEGVHEQAVDLSNALSNEEDPYEMSRGATWSAVGRCHHGRKPARSAHAGSTGGDRSRQPYPVPACTTWRSRHNVANTMM